MANSDASRADDWAAPGGEPTVDDVAPPTLSPPSGPPTAPLTYRSWHPGIIPLRPQGFGDFLSVPLKAMRYNRAVVIGGPLIFTLAAMVLASTALWALLTDPSLALLSPVPLLEGIEPRTVGLGIVAAVALLAADVLSSAVVAPAFARAVLGERITLGSAMSTVRSRIGGLALLYLLTNLTVAVVVLAGVIPLVIGAANSDATPSILGVLVLVFVALPALLIVSMVAGIARPVLVLEQRSAVDAIRRTVRLLRGRFWWSVLVVLVTGAIINVATAVLQQVGGIGATLIVAASPESSTAALVAFTVIFALTATLSYVILYAYMGGVFTLLHIDARIRHEGFDRDLAAAAEARRH